MPEEDEPTPRPGSHPWPRTLIFRPGNRMHQPVATVEKLTIWCRHAVRLGVGPAFGGG
jgi:hypothetical protein